MLNLKSNEKNIKTQYDMTEQEESMCCDFSRVGKVVSRLQDRCSMLSSFSKVIYCIFRIHGV